MDGYPLPRNVPKLKVPKLNQILMDMLPIHAKNMDNRLCHASLLVSKCMVPIMNIMTDIEKGIHVPPLKILGELFRVCNMSMANFNALQQLRKDVVKSGVRNASVKDLCDWNCDIGDEHLFPEDLIKRIEDRIKASRVLRAQRRGSRGRGAQPPYPYYYDNYNYGYNQGYGANSRGSSGRGRGGPPPRGQFHYGYRGPYKQAQPPAKPRKGGYYPRK